MSNAYDLIILGGGVAGMTSAIYASRANLKVLLLDENACGGLVNWTKVVENMPSYKSIGGMELVERVQEQVEELGVTVEEAACIDSMDLSGTIKTIEADDEVYTAKAVIVATGRKPAPLEAAGDCEQVHYCAVCDGSAYIDKRVLIVGGGNSGFDEALSLLDLGISELTLIEKMDRFFAASSTQAQLAERSNATMHLSTEVVSVNHSDKLESVTFRNVETGEEYTHECDGIFVFMGQHPGTESFAELLDLDADGYIVTDDDMATSVPGVFAAGDVRPKKYRQITTAMSDGTIAALEAERFIHSMK
ncbi:NAD(P)/FAD-dependent oxidoreductase [Maridesulfovibrio salexigens]|uniref:FAD-dependent pyridine nucleotide-disulphide oxidoreductase n=1 Tax=Maridesulfovibrio salexigens (strain ATCC 14822 / DSM 2638 / NCIMB 8403 / VKM B-1763) TaxID=526222 RepID=C6BRI5_MARSD|nr:FAD-dependent oxidoreductase [Maridesulfovibrio salexigens]ACS79425.1 FAD-dependent pyridine nucleotide-disulphide oxidoreductase [Maridesulfovibrio salexigens DSM 2638]